MKKIFAAFALTLSFCGSAFCVDRLTLPQQVTQPAYHNMKFHVYKPVNVPREFYVTFDGYLVYRNSKGVWLYGSAEKNGITKTDYVVGAVIPSVVRLKPYNAKISSAAPILGQESERSPAAQTPAVQDTQSPRIVYMPPASGLELYNQPVLSPNNPDWTQNSNFMAISKWQKSVDRIGVINRPMMPAAWQGDYPEVIFAWTGLQWRQVSAKTRHASALSTLRREVYDLSRHARRVNMLRWTDNDTHVLSQYAAMWGYQWMGLIILERDY